MPGVMHTETHAGPMAITAILSICDKQNIGYQRFAARLDDARAETKLHVTYQKFAELAVDLSRTVVPELECIPELDYVAPMMKSLLGSFPSEFLLD